MRHRMLWFGLILMLGTQPIPVLAQSLEEQIQELRQKLSELEQLVKVEARKKEPVKEAEAAEKLKPSTSVVADTSGFYVKSSDGNFVLRLSGDLQTDSRTFSGDEKLPLTDNILLRRVRPTITGTVFKYIDFVFRPDFGGGTTTIYDAYLELKYFPRANMRVGKFKPPVGLERLQSDDDTNFIERGLPTLLAPSRSIGYQIAGDLVKNRISYAGGVFNAVADNSIGVDAATSDHRDYAGRLFLTPFRPDNNVMSGLGVGIAVLGGTVDGVALPSYRTFGQNSFATFANGVTSAGHRTVLAPQAYYCLGPFGLLAEYTLAEEGFRKGAVQRNIAFRSWQVQGAYLLTGEKKVYGTLTPRKAFDPFNGGWGAIELVARVGDFSAEKGFYNYGIADPTKTPRHLHEWVGGVNWYLNRMVKIALDYGNTNFGGGATAGADRPSEKAILQRFQINY